VEFLHAKVGHRQGFFTKRLNSRFFFVKNKYRLSHSEISCLTATPSLHTLLPIPNHDLYLRLVRWMISLLRAFKR
ncbi:hypothetical protein, partial [Legionella sp. ST3F1]|uniref:hypothetical protein n=1 Tax=Legionella sp. ST3F1 TaxID=3402816 RepID=UPI003AF8B3F5